MRKALLSGLIAATLALAPPALAAPKPPPKQASPEQVAAARALADRLTTATGSPGDFSMFVTSSGRLILIHVPSGLRCGFEGLPQEKLELIAATDSHLGGVRCTMDSSGYPTVVEAVQDSGGATLEGLVQATIDADLARLPNATVVKTGPKGRARIPMKDRELKFGETGDGYAYVANTIIGRWLVTIRVEDHATRAGFKADTAEFIGQLQVILAQDVIRP